MTREPPSSITTSHVIVLEDFQLKVQNCNASQEARLKLNDYNTPDRVQSGQNERKTATLNYNPNETILLFSFHI